MAKNKLKHGLKDSSKRLYEWAVAHGWIIEQTKGSHVKFTHPKITRPFFGALTASDHRGALNDRARMRRAMLDAGYTPEQVK